MQFEKWQALGNDYIILEGPRLPFELTAKRIQKLCAPHFGIGSDGILLIEPITDPAFVASLRIFNPDGSEAGLSGNGAREAIMYLRRHGWSEHDRFSISTPAGEVRASITSATECTADMGRARLHGPDFPSGSADGSSELISAGRNWKFQHLDVGNPQCAIWVESLAELESLDLPQIGPGIENHEFFPNRTNVSWYTPVGPGRIRARIFERGVGETAASGTGATGAAIASVLRGGESLVTVLLDGGELKVEVGEDLHVDLTGWAVPVMSGVIAEELMEELRATE